MGITWQPPWEIRLSHASWNRTGKTNKMIHWNLTIINQLIFSLFGGSDDVSENHNPAPRIRSVKHDDELLNRQKQPTPVDEVIDRLKTKEGRKMKIVNHHCTELAYVYCKKLRSHHESLRLLCCFHI